jgi:mRNA interferase RelE/StbE
MGSYELLFKKSVAKDLRELPKTDVRRILQCIRLLADDPRPPKCEKISGQERYRLRQGVYRIVCEIDDNVSIVLVVKIGRRRDLYRTKQ